MKIYPFLLVNSEKAMLEIHHSVSFYSKTVSGKEDTFGFVRRIFAKLAMYLTSLRAW